MLALSLAVWQRGQFGVVSRHTRAWKLSSTSLDIKGATLAELLHPSGHFPHTTAERVIDEVGSVWKYQMQIYILFSARFFLLCKCVTQTLENKNFKRVNCHLRSKHRFRPISPILPNSKKLIQLQDQRHSPTQVSTRRRLELCNIRNEFSAPRLPQKKKLKKVWKINLSLNNQHTLLTHGRRLKGDETWSYFAKEGQLWNPFLRDLEKVNEWRVVVECVGSNLCGEGDGELEISLATKIWSALGATYVCVAWVETRIIKNFTEFWDKCFVCLIKIFEIWFLGIFLQAIVKLLSFPVLLKR